MWSTKTAKSLVKEGKKSDDQLTKRLAEYLGYALDTLDYYEKIIRKRKEKQNGWKNRSNNCDGPVHWYSVL